METQPTTAPSSGKYWQILFETQTKLLAVGVFYAISIIFTLRKLPSEMGLPQK